MKEKKPDPLRSLPAVNTVLQLAEAKPLIEQYGRDQVAESTREALGQFREQLQAKVPGKKTKPPAHDAAGVLKRVAALLQELNRTRLKRVINATGIILHTGLGRAVMAGEVRERLPDLLGPCNIQLDLETGERTQREAVVRDLLRDLTGAEEIVLVNNNAGATLLVLRALAAGREVIVSRGELIEIGGSFRLPDIMEESGAILREVGTTNRTHLGDYEDAIGPDTAMILKVHKSNFDIAGFSAEVGIRELGELGRKANVPVVDDIGCGALVDLEPYCGQHETTMTESLVAGADVVLCSTDKLIGGPQGGLLIGREDLLKQVRAQPLYRALRVDKMMLAALESTLRLFRKPEELTKRHPTYAMLAKSPGDLKKQADDLAKELQRVCQVWTVTVVKDTSRLGGGTLPANELPTFAVSIRSKAASPDEIALQLRKAAVPVIGRVKEDAVLLDMRTVMSGEEQLIIEAAGAAG